VVDPLATVRFYFDYLSSNAYLAWLELPKLAMRYGAVIEPIPVLFAGLLEAHGQLGPAEVLPKALWMARNNLRKAAVLGHPLQPPVHHPFNPLLALRASSLRLPPRERDALITELFRAVWVRGLHVSEPEVIDAIARELGLASDLAARAQAPEVKARLRAATDAAIAAGVFGVPTMIAGDELFWGYDDFPWLERYLAGRDPLDRVELAKWIRAPSPSARRRRFRGAAES
jgi:2-hydroxychromene-2-carboxylate isomerase